MLSIHLQNHMLPVTRGGAAGTPPAAPQIAVRTGAELHLHSQRGAIGQGLMEETSVQEEASAQVGTGCCFLP